MKKLCIVAMVFCSFGYTMEKKRRIWTAKEGNMHHLWLDQGHIEFDDFLQEVKKLWLLDQRSLLTIQYKGKSINQVPDDCSDNGDHPLIIKIISSPLVTAKDILAYQNSKSICAKKND